MKAVSLQSGRLSGIGCLFLAAFLWGCSFPVGKDAMLAVDAYFLTSIRYGVAALILVIALLIAEGMQSLRYDGRMVLVGVLGRVHTK